MSRLLLLALVFFLSGRAAKAQHSSFPVNSNDTQQGLPSLIPSPNGPAVFPIIRDPRPGPNASVIYYQATETGVQRYEAPNESVLPSFIATGVTATGETRGFKPSAANKEVLAAAVAVASVATPDQLAARAGAVQNSQAAQIASFPVQAMDIPIKGTPVPAQFLAQAAVLGDETPVTSPTPEQEAKAGSYYDRARTRLESSQHLFKGAPASVSTALKDVFSSFVNLEAKGAPPSLLRSPLTGLLENSEFQSFGAKQIGATAMNDFNQSVVAGNRILARPKDSQWTAVDSAFQLATGKSGTQTVKSDSQDPEPATGSSVTVTPTTTASSNASSASAAQSPVPGGSLSIPAGASEWLRMARFLASEASLNSLQSEIEKQKRRDGLRALEEWIEALRKFRGLDLLVRISFPVTHSKEDSLRALARARKALRALRDLPESGSPKNVRNIRRLVDLAKKTLKELDAVPNSEEALKVMKDALAEPKTRQSWKALEGVSYEEFRLSAAELIFESGRIEMANVPKSPLATLVKESFTTLRAQDERRDRRALREQESLQKQEEKLIQY